MESSDTDVLILSHESEEEEEAVEDQVRMDIDLIRIPRRKEHIDVLNGIFLKKVYFLNSELTKCVIIGIFKNRGHSLGVLFKGRKGSVYWSRDVFTQFFSYFEAITSALEKKTKFLLRLEGGEDIKVKNVFGRSCAFLYDGEHSLMLDLREWSQFMSNLSIVNRSISELFYDEDLIRDYIFKINSGEEDVLKPDEVVCSDFNQLLEELHIANGSHIGISRIQGQQ